MPDDALRVMLAAALERLRAEQLAKIDAAELSSDSPLRTAVEAAIDSLQERLEHDPEWVDRTMRDILSESEHPGHLEPT